MNKRKFRFIFLVSLIGVFTFFAGEVLLLFVFDNNSTLVSKLWLIFVLVATLGVSAWKCPRD